MPNALHNLVRGCLAAATSLAAVQAVYHRGDQIAHVRVIRGEKGFRVSDDYGGASIHAGQERVFLLTDDLRGLFGQPILIPRSGDEISIADGRCVQRWEVTVNPDGQSWHWTDRTESQMAVYVTAVNVQE